MPAVPPVPMRKKAGTWARAPRPSRAAAPSPRPSRATSRRVKVIAVGRSPKGREPHEVAQSIRNPEAVYGLARAPAEVRRGPSGGSRSTPGPHALPAFPCPRRPSGLQRCGAEDLASVEGSRSTSGPPLAARVPLPAPSVRASAAPRGGAISGLGRRPFRQRREARERDGRQLLGRPLRAGHRGKARRVTDRHRLNKS